MFTVLRTAAGSPVAPSVLRIIRSMQGVRVVAVDRRSDACGFPFADASSVVPSVADDGFVDAMLDVCRREDVNLLFPDLDEELEPLARAEARFEAIGTRLLLSPLSALRVCVDKYATYEFTVREAVPAPRSWLPEELDGEPDLPFPLWVKPRRGRGGRHGYRVDGATALDRILDLVPDPLVQECAVGPEFTIDTLSDLDGRFLYCSVRERTRTKAGVSSVGRTVERSDIASFVGAMAASLGLRGPACFQCIDDERKGLLFIEINPRVGGGVPLSEASGAPIVRDAIRLAMGEEIEGPGEHRAGWRMVRHWADRFDPPNADAD